MAAQVGTTSMTDAVLLLASPEDVGMRLSGLGTPPLAIRRDDRSVEECRRFALRCWLVARLEKGDLLLPLTVTTGGEGVYDIVTADRRETVLVRSVEGGPTPIAALASYHVALTIGTNGETADHVVLDTTRALPTASVATSSLPFGVSYAAIQNIAAAKSLTIPIDMVSSSIVVLDAASNSPHEIDLSRSYYIDFHAWLERQALHLREGRLNDLDRFNLAEELESVGKSDARALNSHLRNLLVHLLKWQLQPERRGESWIHSIENAREEIEDILRDSPSLKSELDELDRTYSKARRQAARELGRELRSLPPSCPYSLEQLQDLEFFPEETTP